MSRGLLALTLLLSLALAGEALAGDLEVRDAWIRQPPPGANAAGYMTLHNTRETALRVVGVRSASAERVELHRSVVEDGVVRMTPVDALEVPAGGQIELAPRGLHLMLIRPRLGDAVELVLELDGGETVTAAVPVRRPSSRSDGPDVDHRHHQRKEEAHATRPGQGVRRGAHVGTDDGAHSEDHGRGHDRDQ